MYLQAVDGPPQEDGQLAGIRRKGSNIDFLRELLQEHVLLITQGVGRVLRIHFPLLDLSIDLRQLFGQTVDTSNRIAKCPIALLTHRLETICQLLEGSRHSLSLLHEDMPLCQPLRMLRQIVEVLEERLQGP